MIVLVCDNLPVGNTGYHRALVHAKNDRGDGIYGVGRATCPLKAAQRACRAELAWRSRLHMRDAVWEAGRFLPLWRAVEG